MKFPYEHIFPVSPLALPVLELIRLSSLGPANAGPAEPTPKSMLHLLLMRLDGLVSEN